MNEKELHWDDEKQTIQGFHIKNWNNYLSTRLALNITTSETGHVPSYDEVKYIFENAMKNQDEDFKRMAKMGLISADPKIRAKYAKYEPKKDI